MVYSVLCDGFYSLTALKIRAPPYSRKVLEVGYGNPVRGDVKWVKWVNQDRYETNGQRCTKLSALLDVCKLHWANKFQCQWTDTSSIGCLISSPSSLPSGKCWWNNPPEHTTQSQTSTVVFNMLQFFINSFIVSHNKSDQKEQVQYTTWLLWDAWVIGPVNPEMFRGLGYGRRALPQPWSKRATPACMQLRQWNWLYLRHPDGEQQRQGTGSDWRSMIALGPPDPWCPRQSVVVQ